MGETVFHDRSVSEPSFCLSLFDLKTFVLRDLPVFCAIAGQYRSCPALATGSQRAKQLLTCSARHRPAFLLRRFLL